ncbi:MAG: hypothetical protein Q8K60_06670 [Parachlamydiaceae bacterium]|nr:hypothetical protein [Parachlamydiaceae bacterium]
MGKVLNSGIQFFNSTVNSTFQGIKNIQSHPLTISTKQTISSYCGKTFVAISTIPQEMQKNNKLAFGVIFTLNSIFYFVINRIASIFEKQLMSKDDGQEVFKRRFIDMSVFVGTLLFNRYGIEAIANYRMSTKANLVISALMVLFQPAKKNINKEDNGVEIVKLKPARPIKKNEPVNPDSDKI